MDVVELGRVPAASLGKEKSPVSSSDGISDAEDGQRDTGGGDRARRGWVGVARRGNWWPGGCGSSRLGAGGGVEFLCSLPQTEGV